MIRRLNREEKEIVLIGTAHVSRESVDLVDRTISEEKPDTVSIELCRSRYQAIRHPDQWQETDIIKVIREKKAFLLLSNLLLSAFQRRIAKKLGIAPGAEMVKAIEAGEAVGAQIHLADRDIRVTLSRVWRKMKLRDKLKLMFHLVMSVFQMDEISEEEIEKMKELDALEAILSEVGKSLPVLRDILIDERDRYLAHRIRTAPGKKIVAVVGAGHVPGIQRYWDTEIDMEALDRVPAAKKITKTIKWLVPALILVLFTYGFLRGGSQAGAHMITWWFVANGVLAGLGALIALGHPLTILSSVVAAPLTSLNPMIAAGWVSGMVEAFSRKPKVKDFQALPEDILSIRGFWKNKITRILLVVVFTNMGSTLGTLVAIPLMVKIL